MLGITHPEIRGHAVVLDEILPRENKAVIRDPFHGWMVAVRLNVFIGWLEPQEDFVQIVPNEDGV